MKQLILILILSFITPLLSFSQETKVKTINFKNSKEVFEWYTVLKSNKEIKHGEYRAYFKASDFNYSSPGQPDYLLRVKGNFVNGKKDGEWIEFSQPNVVKSKGSYALDKKVGIWETTKVDGQVTITERYDFDDKKKLNPYFNANISYPWKAMKAGIEGVVIIGYRKNTDCSVSDISIVKSLSPECDKVVIDLIQKIGELSMKYGLTCEEKTYEQTVPFRIL